MRIGAHQHFWQISRGDDRALLDVFGPQRLMGGSDWSVPSEASDDEIWFGMSENLFSALSEGERTKSFGGTAAEFDGVAS
jgi:predicted TIM-barrel fold metal-dependent hydrolase